MPTSGKLACLGLLVVGCFPSPSRAVEPIPLRTGDAAIHRERVEKSGLTVEFEVESTRPGRPLLAGEDATFRFSVRDSASGIRLPGANPAAWVDSPATSGNGSSNAGIERLLRGGVFGQAPLDLNVYHVAVLNDDATVSVVDPRFGMGVTQLLALVPLPGHGWDWAFSRGERRLFVSIPADHQIISIDTARWEVASRISVGTRATRLALQPDGRFLWSSDGESSLTALEPDTGRVLRRIPVGQGPHEFAFDGSDRFAFVTHHGGDGISVVDLHRLQVTHTLGTGRNPASLAYSELAQALYVSHEASGEIAVVDSRRVEVVARIPCGTDLGAIRSTPGGRYLLALSPKSDRVLVIDASSNRIIQSGGTLRCPAQVSFSDAMAYLSHDESADVIAIPLGQVGREGQPLPMVTIPGGRYRPSEGSQPSPAARVTQAPGSGAVLLANPRDQAVYFYKEGMSAPVGTFQNYGREARAVAVVDRSLKQRSSPGTYETIGRLPQPGNYDVVLLLDAPRWLHRFPLRVGAPANNGHDRVVRVVPESTAAAADSRPFAGEEARITFRIREGAAPLVGVESVDVLIYRAPGIWRENAVARHEADGGFVLRFRPPQPGVYYANVTRIPGVQTIAASEPAILHVVTR